jgi:GTP-binding protein Era
MTSSGDAFRCGYVAIVGEPNVGKSTLLNAILEEKLSIVTSKPQTTRQRVLGILNHPDSQIVFLDTPGLINPRYLLQTEMMHHARSAAIDADVILVLTDVAKSSSVLTMLGDILTQNSEKPILLAINKVDTIFKPELLPMMEKFSQLGMFREIIPISALKKQNTDDLLRTIHKYLPLNEPLYPTDIISEQPEKFFVAEFIREKIFLDFHDEIPYSTAVEIVEFTERTEGKTLIRADIIVERDSQKGMLIGKRGEALNRIGRAARRDIESFIQKEVFLELFVKVREHWRENEGILKRLGYNSE